MGKLRQDVGAETLWKNRSHARSSLVRFFQNVYAQQIDADWPFFSWSFPPAAVSRAFGRMNH
jgi:hypothetical protein